MGALKTVFGNLARLSNAHSRLWAPFVVIALVELSFIGLIWLAPHPPFSQLLAPPLRYFFSDRILHYPWHMLFLYHALKHTNLVTAVLVGAYMSGTAAAMVRQIHEGKTLSLRNALVSRQVHYGRVLLLWALAWAAAKGSMALVVNFMFPKTAWLIMGANLAVMFAMQALLVYVIPIAVFENAKWWQAIVRGVRETLRHPLSTLAIVVLFTAPVIVFGWLLPAAQVSVWMQRTTPEIVVVFVMARVLLWTVCDALLTISASHLWWAHRASALAAAHKTSRVPIAARSAGAA